MITAARRFPRQDDVYRFSEVACRELGACDAYPLLYVTDVMGDVLSWQVGFKLSQAYRTLGATAARTALLSGGLYVANPSDLMAMARASDFRRAPGLAGGGIVLFDGAGGELIGAVGIVATSSTGHAPNGRQVCELVRDVATAYCFGVSQDIN